MHAGRPSGFREQGKAHVEAGLAVAVPGSVLDLGDPALGPIAVLSWTPLGSSFTPRSRPWAPRQGLPSPSAPGSLVRLGRPACESGFPPRAGRPRQPEGETCTVPLWWPQAGGAQKSQKRVPHTSTSSPPDPRSSAVSSPPLTPAPWIPPNSSCSRLLPDVCVQPAQSSSQVRPQWGR